MGQPWKAAIPSGPFRVSDQDVQTTINVGLSHHCAGSLVARKIIDLKRHMIGVE